MMLERILYAGAGFGALALAIAGALLPGLPTTIFVIVGAYCFARSIPRMERWLLANRWLGGGLRRFRETGGMTRRAKAGALLSMWISVLISATLLARTGLTAPLAVIGAAVAGTIVLIYRVSTVSEPGRGDESEI